MVHSLWLPQRRRQLLVGDQGCGGGLLLHACMCRSPFGHGLQDEDSEDEFEVSEDEDDGENDTKKTAMKKGVENKPESRQCDGSETCLCNRPAPEHPEHQFTITNAGVQKYGMQHIHADLRRPDLFQMYTLNDHAGYGLVGVVQDLLLDFVENGSGPCAKRRQCFFLLGDLGPMFMVDDETVTDTCLTVVCMLLTVLGNSSVWISSNATRKSETLPS
ncbi:hypothetical protein VTO42DRAFT_4734 [Malbranchea cinnamomea]